MDIPTIDGNELLLEIDLENEGLLLDAHQIERLVRALLTTEELEELRPTRKSILPFKDLHNFDETAASLLTLYEREMIRRYQFDVAFAICQAIQSMGERGREFDWCVQVIKSTMAVMRQDHGLDAKDVDV